METMLHVAVFCKNIEMVEFILEQDFGKYLARTRDLRRMTPLEVAQLTKQAQVVNIFEEMLQLK